MILLALTASAAVLAGGSSAQPASETTTCKLEFKQGAGGAVKVCMTAREREERRAESQQNLREIQLASYRRR